MTTRNRTTSRDRTMSSRKRAGSRKGNGRKHIWRDNRRTDPGIGFGLAPNHEAREIDLFSAFPKAPGAKIPAKLHA